MYLTGRGLIVLEKWWLEWQIYLGYLICPPPSSLLLLLHSPHILMETTCLLGQQWQQRVPVERPAEPSSASIGGQSWLVAWLQLSTAALESAPKRGLLHPSSSYWGGKLQLLLRKPNGPAFAVSISLRCQQASRGTR